MTRNGEKASGKLPQTGARKPRKDPWHKKITGLYNRQPVAFTWIVNVITGALILFIITHSSARTIQKLYKPPAKDEDPVIAVRDFQVPRDIEVLDKEGTEKKRAEAEALTRSRYDWDPSVGENIKQRISAFFKGLRDLHPEEAKIAAGTTSSSQPAAALQPFLTEKKQELVRNLGASLSSEDLSLLEQKHFAPELEKAVTALISEVYQNDKGKPRLLVPTKDMLLKESDKGIIAYRIKASEQTPLEINDLDPAMDIASAQEVIDKAAQKHMKDMEPATRILLSRMAKDLLDPNLTFNKKKTEEAKASAMAAAKPRYYKFKKGEVIVRKGDRLSPETRTKVEGILDALDTSAPRSLRSVGLMVLVIFLLASMVTFSMRNIRKFSMEPKDILFLSLVLVISLAVLRAVEVFGNASQETFLNVPEGLNFYYLIPLAGAVMLVRMVLNSEIALVFAVIVSILGGIVADNSLLFGVYTLVGSVVAAGEVRQCRQRSTILRAGLALGLINAIIILAVSMAGEGFISMVYMLPNSGLLWNIFFGLFGGVFVAIIVTGVVPLAESVFSYATDIKLLELLNQDSPLLKDLSMRAPGTHQHSLMVANLAEAAAKFIGANPLLTRVCAMYHDIGKMNKPLYFAENQWDNNNVHQRLSPSMSTLVIHNHVKEGLERGVKAKLPPVVIDCIQQHHGTSLLTFFYEKAKEMNESGTPLDENKYRYQGPRPQTREAAIIMLADVVESASRTVRDPNPARMKGMVQKLINRFFIDGQLDDCDLTLKDLHQIARSFNTTLEAIYHHRPDYPLPAVKGQAAEKKKKAEHDAAGHKDKTAQKDQAEKEKDKEDSENYLRRLGM